MKRLSIFLVVPLAGVTLLLTYFSFQGAAYADAGTGNGVQSAVCVLVPFNDDDVDGTIKFMKDGQGVHVTGEVHGLKPGQHGFHVHEFGDVSDLKTGKSAGGHFNPTDQPHGKPSYRERHVGDLGNIRADDNGVAIIDIHDDVIQLNGPYSIVGRAIIIHMDADKFTQPTGDAGARAAGGVIGVAKES